jgi:hypothetical protein
MSGTKERNAWIEIFLGVDLAPLRTEAAASQQPHAVRPDGEKPGRVQGHPHAEHVPS